MLLLIQHKNHFSKILHNIIIYCDIHKINNKQKQTHDVIIFAAFYTPHWTQALVGPRAIDGSGLDEGRSNRRKTALQGALVLTKSERLELGDTLLQTL